MAGIQTVSEQLQTPMVMTLADEDATVSLGARLGRVLEAGTVMYLEGGLGAGKTTLCRGILRAFGHEGAVKSPTYTLVEPYPLKGRQIYHFDLYRLGDPEELEYMGIRDYFAPENICLVEWPERARGVLPAADITVKVTVASPGRAVALRSQTARGEQMLSNLG